jgi:CARDB
MFTDLFNPLDWRGSLVALGQKLRFVPPVLALISVFLASSCADHQGVDLALGSSVQLDPQLPVANQRVLLTIVAENRSGDYSSATSMAVRIDGATVVTVPIDPLAGGESRQIATSFSCGQSGAHSVAVILDPDQSTDDPDRNKNVLVFSPLVGSSAG